MKFHQKLYLPLKRLIGLLGSFVGIVVCFFFLWWWIILVNLFVCKGHPFFVQERVGRNFKSFKLLKFRTMTLDADPNMSSGEAIRSNKYTKFGSFLRKTSLDETIQLINIFFGQMAFIGPRPLIYSGEDTITVDLRKENGSIALRPGLSGYAQVNGRIVVSPENKAEMDLYYLQHISLLFDIKLFFISLFKFKN